MKLPKGKRNKKDIYKQIEYLIYDTRSKKKEIYTKTANSYENAKFLYFH